MRDDRALLTEEYAAAFEDYLRGAGEAALQRAYELARRAIDEGLGVLDITAIYQETLAKSLLQTLTIADTRNLARAAAAFFCESISPFELTHRSFQEAHMSLRASEERYRELFENASDIVFTLDPEGNLTSINRAGEEICGYDREEAIGMNIAQILAPEHWQIAHQMLESKIAGGGSKTYEAEILAKNGRRFAVEISTRLVHQNEKAAWIQGIARDITERRRAEKRFSALLESAPDAMVVVDQGGKIVLVNAQAENLFGYNRQELLGKPVETLVPELSRGRHSDHRETFFGEPRARRMGGGIGLFALRKGGEEFPVEISLSPIETAEGILVSSAIRDITERKKAEEAMRRMNEALEEQTRRIAHALHDESGQLLASVHIALEDVAQELPPGAQGRIASIKDILDQIEEQLRQFSRELRPTILDDLGLLPALEFLTQGVSRRANIAIVVDYQQKHRLPAHIETAIYRIAQEALTNVTRHAKASRVEIKVNLEPPKVHGSIRDDGIGFDAPSVMSRKGQHSLGLVGIRTRLDALGGSLSISSQLGNGTEIAFEIPLEKANGDPNPIS